MRLALPCLVLLACTEPPSPATTTIDLGRPSMAPLERIPLVPLRLSTQAELDALEDSWLPRRDAADLVAALQALAAAQDKPEPILLQRIAVLLGDDVGQDGRGIQPVLAVSARLRELAPDDPHTLWLGGWVLFESLTRRGRIEVDGDGRALADVLVEQWSKLLAAAPDYVGPRGWDAARVASGLARVRAALAEAAQPAPAAAGQPARLATAPELAALDALERFRGANEGNRRGVCRDWRGREPVAQPSTAELRMDLQCAVHAGDAANALGAIGALMAADGPAFDACSALAQLTDRVGAKAVEAARSARPLALTCP
ncbi:MAG: hypothetical protein IT385_07200 [Deltaproteobacteria bacterium]|nr:hypothetical protein [Deltaproteobacteria bacterium]